MKRPEMIQRLEERDTPWDILVVGGGATGLGIAVDAAARGHDVALIEQSDFAKGTSSRSTKLVHGGVRYLQQGNISLVMEALHERGILRRNAPHLVSDLAFVVPNYEWWESPFYGIGMKVYDMLAGKYGFGKSRNLTLEQTVERLPTIETEGLRGGTIYYDGQFDDARLAIHLAITAVEQGAVLANYCQANSLLKAPNGVISGVVAQDVESGRELRIEAKAVVNATGAFSDVLRQLDEPKAKPIIAPSQGVHIVLPSRFLSGESAIMVPRTDDGRVMFAIPWHDRVVVGTTDTPIDSVDLEPRPLDEEIEFILETAGRYLDPSPTRGDVLSVFTGIRPLVKGGDDSDTASLSRDHTLLIGTSGLITIAGGKWTTYRRMGQDVVDKAELLADLEQRPSPTETLNIHGYHEHADRFGPLALYGSDAIRLSEMLDDHPELREPIHPDLPALKGEIIWGARYEMARTVDDALARRTRSLLLDAKASIEAAPIVAQLLAEELGFDDAWQAAQVAAFNDIAIRYVIR